MEVTLSARAEAMEVAASAVADHTSSLIGQNRINTLVREIERDRPTSSAAASEKSPTTGSATLVAPAIGVVALAAACLTGAAMSINIDLWVKHGLLGGPMPTNSELFWSAMLGCLGSLAFILGGAIYATAKAISQTGGTWVWQQFGQVLLRTAASSLAGYGIRTPAEWLSHAGNFTWDYAQSIASDAVMEWSAGLRAQHQASITNALANNASSGGVKSAMSQFASAIDASINGEFAATDGSGGAMQPGVSPEISIDYALNPPTVANLTEANAQGLSYAGGVRSFVTPGLSRADFVFSLSQVVDGGRLVLAHQALTSTPARIDIVVNGSTLASGYTIDNAVTDAAGLELDLGSLLRSGSNTITLKASSGGGYGLRAMSVEAVGSTLTPVSAPAPVLASPSSVISPGDNFTLNWTSVSGASSYILEASSTSNFTSPTRYTPTTNSYQQQIFSAGTRYYRVKAASTPFSNIVAVTAVAAPTTGVLSSNPPALVESGTAGSMHKIKPLILSIPGFNTFTWNAFTRQFNGPNGWLRVQFNSGDQSKSVEVRLDPQSITTAGTYTGEVEISSQTSSTTLKVPVTFNVTLASQSGIDLAVESVTFPDPARQPCLYSNVDVRYSIRNVGTQAASDVTSSYDYIFWSRNGSMTMTDLFAEAKAGRELESTRAGLITPSLNAGAAYHNVERVVLGSSGEGNCPRGASYLYIVADLPHKYASGLPGYDRLGWVPEANDTDREFTNNMFVMPLNYPTLPSASVQPSALTVDVTPADRWTGTVNLSNGGDGTLTWSTAALPAGFTLIPASGSLLGNSQQALTVIIDASARPVGSSTSSIAFTSNGGSVSLPITTNVTTPGVIETTPLGVSWSVTAGVPLPQPMTIGITNAGPNGTVIDGLSVQGISYSQGSASGWLRVVTAPGTVAPTQMSIGLSTTNVSPGTHQATIALQSTAAGVAPYLLTVQLTVVAAPVISVTPAALVLSLATGGQPRTDSVSIVNAGPAGTTLSGLSIGQISYTSGAGGWLTQAALNSATAPARLLVSASPVGMAPGRYSAQVPIVSSTGGVAPRSLAVTLDVVGQPDLVSGTITLTPANPTEAQTVGLSASIANGGTVAASGIGWQLKVDGAVVGSGTIASLAAGASTPVGASNLGPYTAGAHVATLEVDFLNAIAESNESNNTATASFTVAGQSDLLAGPLTVTPANPTTTQSVALNSTVANTGTVAASNVGWWFKVDGMVVGSGTIASLAVGASTPVSAANLGPYAVGAHTATLEVDFANAIAESNESNNVATTNFSVSGLPDLVSGAITVTPANPTAVQTVGLSASITNSGTVVASSIGWQLKVDGAVVGSGTIASLLAGASTPVSAANLGPYAAGAHAATLEVDFSNVIAESSESNNSTTASFTVVGLPDLVAGGITVSPSNPTSVQPVGLSASITNSGVVTASSIEWQLKVDGAVVGSGTITSLAAGASTPVGVANLGPYAPGAHTAVLEVDVANAIAESSEANNTASQGFSVGPAPVDLVAGAVSVSPTNPTTTQSVTLIASVANAGTATASTIAWRFKVDGAVAGSGTIASLSAGASTPVSVATLGPFAVGAHTVMLEVDFANAIAESNESNNTTTANFSVVGSADLVAGPITLTPPNPTEVQQVRVNASVTNGGTVAAGSIVWRFTVDGAVVGSGTIASLAAGSSAPVSLANLGPYAVGVHTATLEVDFANAIAESNENNNTATINFTVSGLPDLVAGAITVTPANPTAVQSVGLSASVSNSGTVAASSIGWRLKVDGIVVGSGTIASLAAGASLPASVANLGPYPPGARTAVLEVDFANAIAETSEMNNSSSQGFSVGPAPVDLVAGGVTVTPSTPTPTQTVTLAANVANTGTATASSISWRFRVDGVVVGGGTIASAAPGASTPVSVTNLGPYALGAHTAALEVDFANAIAESNESNNTTTANFSVVGLADLVAGPITVIPASPTLTQLVTLNSTVSNAGSAVASSVGWRLRLDGSVVGSGTISSLAAGASALVSAANLGPYAAGVHAATLEVDFANSIAESNENNNTTTASFTVAGLSDLVAGSISITPPSPTTTQTVAVSASIVNAGTATASSVGWQLKVDGVVVGSGTVANLAAGASTPVSATNLGPYAQGAHTAALEVDFANAIAESNESNNGSNQAFTVGPTPVDLVAGALVVTPANPTTAQTVTVSASVANAGTAPANGIAWRIRMDGVVVGSGTLASLAAGASTPVTVANLGPYAQGAHAATLEVDFGNAIAESSESNNTSTANFAVSGLPDLAAGTITANPTNAQTVGLGASVTNAGTALASGIMWRFRVDGSLVGSGTIANLAAGATAPVSVANVGPYAPGAHTATLEVDFANEIAESNENNNATTANFTIEGQSDMVAGPITVTPANPTANQVVGLSATITNSGTTAASNVAWQFKIDGTVVGSGTIASLAAAVSAPISMNSVGPLTVGTHTAVLEVDPANAVAESNESNNSSNQSFSVSVSGIIPQQVVDRMVGCLLGATCQLSLAEREYADAQGNRNGSLDVGDLLALLDRNLGTLSREQLMDVLASPRTDSVRLPIKREREP